jgi:two-component system chemotaxis response regulator CheY
MVEREAAAASVHAMETVFVSVRDGKLTLSKEVFDLALAELDLLGQLADTNREDAPALAELTSQWRRVADATSGQGPVAMNGLPFELDPNEVGRLQTAVKAGQQLYLVEKSIYSSLSHEEYDGLPIFQDIASIGSLVARRPRYHELKKERPESVLLILMATGLAREKLECEIFDPFHHVILSEQDKHTNLRAKSCAPPAPHVTPGIRSLIVEDDFTSRLVMQKFLAPVGEAHVAVDGEEALAAIQMALQAEQPYQLVCLDIMMPKLDGQAVLCALRALEEAHGLPAGKGAKVIMTTCLKDGHNVMTAFKEQCDAYVVKPVDLAKLRDHLRRFGFLAG